MATFDVAHIRQSGQDMIIVVVDSSFGSRPLQTQRENIAWLQQSANAAGLAGTVVPVWDSFGKVMSMPPDPWRPFFQSISWDYLRANINKRLTCS